MTERMKGTARRGLAGSALCGLIVLATVPAAAQWLPPPWAATPPAIRQSLEAQGYVLIAPLQRRPYVYLADVSAGPAGYQRLVIDARSGEILQRFVPPARRWGPQIAERSGLLAGPPLPGFAEPGPIGAFSTMPDGGPATRSAYGGPAGVRIPAAISPVGSPDALPATKPKPKSTKPQGAGAAAPAAAVPLPPPKPMENQDSDEPKTNSPPTEVESVPPAAPEGAKEDASKASAAAPPDLKPETAPGATAQSEAPPPQPSATTPSVGRAPQPTARDSSPEPSEKSKVSIVPATLFE